MDLTRPGLAPALLVSSLLLSSSATAYGAEVTLVKRRVPQSCAPHLDCSTATDYVGAVNVRAAPGERNDVTFAVVVDDSNSDLRRLSVVITDKGPPLTAGAGCVTHQDGTASCTLGGPADTERDYPRELVIGSVDLGDGDDRVVVPARAGVRGGEGNGDVTVEYRGSIDGGDGDDVITSSGSPRVTGGAGNDTITAAGAENAGFDSGVLRGGAGNDYITGANELFGEDGNDVLIAAAGRGAHLSGGSGNDVVAGGVASDVLSGGPGADRVDGGSGSGEDLFDASDAAGPLHLDLTQGPDVDPLGEGDVVTGIEAYVGTPQDDVVRAGAEGVTVRGAGGNDSLTGGPGIDRLDGGDGADQISGGGGDDVLFGGSGRDRIDGGSGADALSGGTDFRASDGFGAFGDADSGDDDRAPDRIDGGAGPDRLFPRGADRVRGDSGADRIDAAGLSATDLQRYVRCGSGVDLLIAEHVPDRSCELLPLPGDGVLLGWAATRTRDGAAVTIRRLGEAGTKVRRVRAGLVGGVPRLLRITPGAVTTATLRGPVPSASRVRVRVGGTRYLLRLRPPVRP